MKALKYIMMGVLVSLTISCGNDWLDVEPSTEIPSQSALVTLDDADKMLNGIYARMSSASYYSGALTYFGDMYGDDMMSTDSHTDKYYKISFTKDNAPSGFWSYGYNIIQQCNTILSQIDGIEIQEAEEEYRNDLKGQALVLRGYALFDLTRLYGYPYAKDNGASLGAAILLETSDTGDKPARSTVAECYGAIIKDLKEGSDLMYGDYYKGKINKWAGKLLLSRAYLYKEDNKNALATAEEAIEGAEKNGYHLWSNEEYASVWGTEFSEADPGEVLYECVNSPSESAGKDGVAYVSWEGGYGSDYLTSSFYELMQEDPDDVRNKCYKLTTKADGETVEGRAYLTKYGPEQAGESMEDANVPVLRLSELYLIAAEAAVKENNNGKAVQYLDAVVNRANPDRTVQGKTVTLDDVLTECRKEFVGEGHRFFDAIRNGKEIVRRESTKTFPELYQTKHEGLTTEARSFDWNYYRVVLPVPRAEMNANQNMVQNPVYGD